MSVRDWFARRLTKAAQPGEKKSFLLPFDWNIETGLPSFLLRGRRRRWTTERIALEAYARAVWVWKPVEVISENFAARTFRFKEPGAKAGEFVDDHPLYPLLNHGKANGLETGFEFKKRLMSQLLLSERGVFVEKRTTRRGTITALKLLSPIRTRPIPNTAGDEPEKFEVLLPGGGIRTLEPDQVSWIKNAHPFDPWMSTTPIGEERGLSVELDDLGRLINVTWMSNDGNTRGIVAVKGGMDENDSAKLERRFGIGPVDAGKVSVVSADDVSFVDLSKSPRDMQYKEVAAVAKVEQLGLFGVPESKLGNASARTFNNAEIEGYNFWTITMDPKLKLVAPAFADATAPELEPVFDTSDVPELQLPMRERRKEAREEVAAGLRSRDSYAELARIEIESTPETRALWMPQGFKPLDQDPGANERVTLQPPEPAPALPTGDPNQPQPEPQQPQIESGKPAKPQPAIAADARPQTGAAAARQPEPQPQQSKALTGEVADDVDETALAAATAEVSAALVALTARWAARTQTRLTSPKARKGTRHWQADPTMPTDNRVGDQPLDTTAAVDPDSWAAEATAAVAVLLTAAATTAGAATLAALTADTITPAIVLPADVAAEVVDTLAAAVRSAGQQLAERLAQLDHDGRSLDDITAAVDTAKLARWGRSLAAIATSSAVERGRYHAARLLAAAGLPVEGVWRSRGDDRVRLTHRAADGQARTPGVPFLVGGVLLRFPRDPLGPAPEVLGCRCKVRWRRATAKAFAVEPPDAAHLVWADPAPAVHAATGVM